MVAADRELFAANTTPQEIPSAGPVYLAPHQLLTTTMAPSTNPTVKPTPTPSIRKNAKSWHPRRTAFRPTPSTTTFAKRMARTTHDTQVKELAAEMKAEKAAERERRIQGIKDRRAAKEERERFQRMEEKMHRKRVERVKRREGRNKKLEGGK